MKKKTLAIMRHGDRSSSGFATDDGLTPKGERQAGFLLSHFKSRFGATPEEPPRLLSSARRRCIETLQPIADLLKRKIEISPLLMEGLPNEGHADFINRIVEFRKWWENEAPAFTVICTHGDWVPHFLAMTIGEKIDLKKGGWAEISLTVGGEKNMMVLEELLRPQEL